MGCLQWFLQGATYENFWSIQCENLELLLSVKLCFGYCAFIMQGTAGLSLAPVLAWQNNSVDLSKMYCPVSSCHFPSLHLGELHAARPACAASLQPAQAGEAVEVGEVRKNMVSPGFSVCYSAIFVIWILK